MTSLCWASDFWQAGNAFGYSVHNRMMREHVSKYVRLTGDAPTALTIASADKFRPVQGKFNFLFTMFETEHLPASYVRRLPDADHVIVPCDHNRRVFARYTDRPISVCPEGCDAQVFSYRSRREPRNRPFRFLWVGAPNPRKGYQSLVKVWEAFAGDPTCELYVKTTAPVGRAKNPRVAALLDQSRQRPVRIGNIIFDARKVSLDDLVGIYHDAHAFLLPSTGEGWGLTLTEAMCTGLPCIATRYAGTEMYFDRRVGYPVRHKLMPYFVENYGLATEIAIPDTLHLYEQMRRVRSDYRGALARGKRAARRIREQFTWDRAARILAAIVNNPGSALDR